MKELIFTLLINVIVLTSKSQSITGNWHGELKLKDMKLNLALHIRQTKDSLHATILPARDAKAMVVDRIQFKSDSLQFEVKRIFAYRGKLHNDSIVGAFIQTGKNIPLTFKRDELKTINSPARPQTPKAPFNYNIEDLSFKNPVDKNTLAGTLTTPENKKQFPMVVMITGSGDQDRNETLFDHKPFWVIADHLTKNGIGVLRLDDRGVGGSSKGKPDPTSADFAADIDAAVNYLARRGYKNIGLIGHSEGGMIAPMVSAKNKDVKFLISMAGPGIPVDELMISQTYSVSKSMGATEEVARNNAETNKKIYHFVKTYQGEHFEDSVKVLIESTLANSPETKFLPDEQKRLFVSQQVKTVSNPWIRYFLKFDPSVYLTKLKIPVLAINGSKDIQVLAKENLEGWKTSLQTAGNKKFEIKEFEGLNHLFQEAKTGAVAEYGQIEQTISPKVLDFMTKWILKLK